MKRNFILYLCLVSLLAFGATLSEKRDALVSGSCTVEQLQRTLKVETDPILRRTAVRLLAEQGEAAVPVLKELVRTDKDPQVGKNALLALWQLQGNELDSVLLDECMTKGSAPIRVVAASILFSERPLDDSKLLMAQKYLMTEKDKQVCEILNNATWTFRRNVLLLKDRPDWDHEVFLEAEYPLPLEGWAFKTDPSGNFHLTEKCYAENYDDSAWPRISIGKTWEDCGFKYDGYAWYRRTFDAPAKPAVCNAAELHFGSVDEVAYVWLNGQYVGEHNLGDNGWNVPFSLDVTDLIRWGEPNQITVRVFDRAFAGGIYLPVQLQIMK